MRHILLLTFWVDRHLACLLACEPGMAATTGQATRVRSSSAITAIFPGALPTSDNHKERAMMAVDEINRAGGIAVGRFR